MSKQWENDSSIEPKKRREFEVGDKVKLVKEDEWSRLDKLTLLCCYTVNRTDKYHLELNEGKTGLWIKKEQFELAEDIDTPKKKREFKKGDLVTCVSHGVFTAQDDIEIGSVLSVVGVHKNEEFVDFGDKYSYWHGLENFKVI